MTTLSLQRPIAFFDLETTGTSTNNDKIVQIAILRVETGGTKRSLERLINPKIPIPLQAIQVHGISDQDVAGKPSFENVAEEILSWLSDCDLAGYNILGFDLPLIKEEFQRCQITFPSPDTKIVDVMKIFMKKEQRTLKDAYRFYCNKNLKDAHNAVADVEATYEILLGQLDMYSDLGNSVEELHDFTCPKGMIDLAEKLIRNEKGEILFNFGKNKGRPVLSDPSYIQWMLKGDFPEETKNWLKKILDGSIK